ncbi:unnamed protein product [Arabidopsis halleri]
MPHQYHQWWNFSQNQYHQWWSFSYIRFIPTHYPSLNDHLPNLLGLPNGNSSRSSAMISPAWY